MDVTSKGNMMGQKQKNIMKILNYNCRCCTVRDWQCSGREDHFRPESTKRCSRQHIYPGYCRYWLPGKPRAVELSSPLTRACCKSIP